MPDVETAHAIPFARLNDPAWRENFGQNVRTCLQILDISPDQFAEDVGLDIAILQGIMAGTFISNHEIIEPIRLKIGLPISDIIMVYGTDYLRHLKLSNKLTALKEPPKPRRSKPAVMTEDGRYDLSDPDVKKAVAINIKRLALLKFPTFTMRLFLGGVGKNEAWLSNLKDSRASLTEAVLQRFATKLGVESEMLLSGKGIDELESRIRKHKT